jgi:histidinol-phosphatase (PHP family)
MTILGDFDILGHLDIPGLTAKQIYGLYDPSRYEQAIRAVLGNCIQRGIVLEINTQGLRKPGHMLSPGVEILRWFVEMGGESMVPGSDAHTADQMGMHIESIFSLAHQVGFKTYTTFKKRIKQIYPLPGVT